jgi:predicted transcriptional regulator
MVRKIRRTHIGENQRKILDILSKYQELTAKDIAEILWARDIHYKTPEYTSAHRSLAALCEKGLVEKVGGQLKWRKTKRASKKMG